MLMWVIVAEPWFGGSHRAWAEGYAASSRHDVTVVGLPPSGWRWRLRAGAGPLADQIRQAVDDRGAWPPVLLVSGLVDVSSLLGHLRAPSDLVVVVYMHETQLIYPTVDGSVDSGAALHNWNSWLVADAVWFNSGFHRQAVVDALPSWAAAQPEPIGCEVVDGVIARFQVLPVGVGRPSATRARRSSARPTILWPHRWEPDKAPDVFARAVDKLVSAGVEFDLVLAGEDPGRSQVRADVIARHADRVRAVGPFPRPEYEHWLAASDIVVSCAAHEFFGVGVVEAMMAGCVPILPEDLSYPELIPPRLHSTVLYRRGTFGRRLLETVVGLDDHRSAVAGLAEGLSRFEWANIANFYDTGIDELVGPSDLAWREC
jgi:glycosyltransferase involved in cell wall biosynthesis